jgi:Fe-S cluster biogenesis protein NfuA
MEATPNPDSLKFLPEDRQVLPEALGSGLHFSSIAEARGSKLVRTLLKHGEITGVFLGRDFLSVNKRESAAWQPLKVVVVDAIMDAYAELEAKGTPIVELPAAAEDTAVQPEDSEVVAMIKELIETRIRPAVQEDGGDIFFVCVVGLGPCRGALLSSPARMPPCSSHPLHPRTPPLCACRSFEEDTGVVKVRMAGSCVGCPSSSATLKNGVENMLMHYIPEVKKIEQVLSPVEEEGEKALSALEAKLAAAGAQQ